MVIEVATSFKKVTFEWNGFSFKIYVIGNLPGLAALKLRSYAFQGSRWDAQRNSFRELQFLLIEDSDLVQLKPSLGFTSLNYLSVKHCYKLKEICRPASLYTDFNTVEIELEDCNPLALTCVSQLRPGDLNTLNVIASSSFYEKPTTIKIRRHGSGKLRRREEWEVEDINEDQNFEGKGDDEYTNTSEEHEEESDGEYTSDDEDTEGDDLMKILPLEERVMKARALMRIQKKRMRKRVMTNMRMIMANRKQRQAPTSRRIIGV
ncbi:uncharacterized protein LOC125208929 isoform X2 [Salvia hispanica]|uniref:uncharacterized protein LOC125208929 isoform X2 n=1 Tax=Salvia hispanica TaxID=49212 RepID=UPI0020090FD4|nr:uncharacterized protein LOC125208929 isoform X2 [Salvia hispanica]